MVNKTLFKTYEYNSIYFFFIRGHLVFFCNLFLYFNASVGSCNSQGHARSHHRVTTSRLGPGKPAALHFCISPSFLAPPVSSTEQDSPLYMLFPEKNTFLRSRLSKVYILSPHHFLLFTDLNPGNLVSGFWILTLLLKLVEFLV